jgi:hypothetical protein
VPCAGRNWTHILVACRGRGGRLRTPGWSEANGGLQQEIKET